MSARFPVPRLRHALLAMTALLVAAAMAAEGHADAQPGHWQPLLSLRSGTFYSTAFMTESAVFASGPGGILGSQDGGRSWSWVVMDSVADMAFGPDGVHGWVVGRDGRISATADGGKTWLAQQSGTELDLFEIAAFDSQSLIVLGQESTTGSIPTNVLLPHVILRSDDGGQSWQGVWFPESYLLSSLVTVPGSNRAWLKTSYCGPKKEPDAIGGCGWEAVTFRSDDRGKTWRKVDQGPQPWSPRFASAKVGWALEGHALKRTDDGGQSWRTVREWQEGEAYGHELTVLGEEVVVLVETANGESQIVKTSDGGESWGKTGQPRSIRSLTFFDEKHAVLADWETPLSWSDDGGATWQKGETPIFARGWAFDFVGSSGWLSGSKLMRTTDGGITWEPVSDLVPVSLDFVSPTEGWAIGGCQGDYPCQHAVLHTVDGGVTWEERARFPGGSLAGITFVDALNGWVETGGDSQPPLLRTRDGGQSWQGQQAPGVTFDFVDKNVIWSAGYASPGEGNLQRPVVSYDGGDSWRQAGSLQAHGMTNVYGLDALHAWVSSEEYMPGPDGGQIPPFALHRTVDGGATWARLGERSRERVYDYEFFTASDGVATRAVCSGGQEAECIYQLLRTSDGGVTWSAEAMGDNLLHIKFSDSWHGWALNTDAGYETRSVTLYRYSKIPQVVMPETGERLEGSGRSPDRATQLTIAGLAVVAGASLVGAALALQRRARRMWSVGGWPQLGLDVGDGELAVREDRD